MENAVFRVTFCMKKHVSNNVGSKKLRGSQVPRGEARLAPAEGGLAGPMGCSQWREAEGMYHQEQNLGSFARCPFWTLSSTQVAEAASEGRRPPCVPPQRSWHTRCPLPISTFHGRYQPVPAAIT